MNIVVLSKSRREGNPLAMMLMAGGANRIRVVCGVCQAERAVRQIRACCVCFDRSFAESYETFFQQFSQPNLYFIPFSPQADNQDIIDALNTHRTAYYLIGNYMLPEVQMAIRCLKEQMLYNSYTVRGAGRLFDTAVGFSQ